MGGSKWEEVDERKQIRERRIESESIQRTKVDFDIKPESIESLYSKGRSLLLLLPVFKLYMF